MREDQAHDMEGFAEMMIDKQQVLDLFRQRGDEAAANQAPGLLHQRTL